MYVSTLSSYGTKLALEGLFLKNLNIEICGNLEQSLFFVSGINNSLQEKEIVLTCEILIIIVFINTSNFMIISQNINLKKICFINNHNFKILPLVKFKQILILLSVAFSIFNSTVFNYAFVKDFRKSVRLCY